MGQIYRFFECRQIKAALPYFYSKAPKILEKEEADYCSTGNVFPEERRAVRRCAV